MRASPPIEADDLTLVGITPRWDRPGQRIFELPGGFSARSEAIVRLNPALANRNRLAPCQSDDPFVIMSQSRCSTEPMPATRIIVPYGMDRGPDGATAN